MNNTTKRPMAPYGKKLHQLIARGEKLPPKVYVHVGDNAFQKAYGCNQVIDYMVPELKRVPYFRERTIPNHLTLPGKKNPHDFSWPVKNHYISIKEWSPVEGVVRMSLLEALFRDGVIGVVIITHDWEIIAAGEFQ